MKMTIKHFFDAGHQLKDCSDLVTKACSRLHGHTYATIIEFEKDELKENGMVIDFKAIKNVVDELDHRFLNDILDVEPTAENIALHIKGRIKEEFDLDATVSICEGYKGQEKASWVTT